MLAIPRCAQHCHQTPERDVCPVMGTWHHQGQELQVRSEALALPSSIATCPCVARGSACMALLAAGASRWCSGVACDNLLYGQAAAARLPQLCMCHSAYGGASAVKAMPYGTVCVNSVEHCNRRTEQAEKHRII